jgi:hypothetical protein
MPDASDSITFKAKGETVVLKGLQDFIRTQGTLMLLLPGLTGLRQLSEDR